MAPLARRGPGLHPGLTGRRGPRYALVNRTFQKCQHLLFSLSWWYFLTPWNRRQEFREQLQNRFML